MIRVKLPFGGVTPEQMEAFADLAETYTPLRKGHITTRQNFQFHHIPLADAAKAIRMIGDSGLSTREACGNTVRNVTGDPWAGVCDDEPFDITPYAAAYARYFVRHPVTQLMPRKFKTAFAASDEDRAITGIHDLGFIPKLREVDGEQVRGFEMRVGGGTSIMPRIAPTLTEFAEADNGEYLRVAEAALRIFDRQEWLRKNRARARIKVLVDKIGIEQFRELVDEELEGEWAHEHDYSADLERMKFEHDEESNAPAAAGRPWIAERRPLRVRRVRRHERSPAAPAGVLDDPGEGVPRRSVPGAVPRPGSDHARPHGRLRAHEHPPEHGASLGAQRVDLRRVGAPARARARGRRSGRGRRRGQLPRNRQLQARDHELDGAQRGSPPAARRDADRRSSDEADPHQDERLPQRMQPAPHRQHRVLRRVAQGRRSPGAGVHPPRRRTLRGRRGRLRRAPQVAPARQARAGRDRALDPVLRGRAQRRRGLQRVRRQGRWEALPGARQGPVDAGRRSMSRT